MGTSWALELYPQRTDEHHQHYTNYDGAVMKQIPGILWQVGMQMEGKFGTNGRKLFVCKVCCHRAGKDNKPVWQKAIWVTKRNARMFGHFSRCTHQITKWT